MLPYINDTDKNLLGILDGCAVAGVSGVIQFGMGTTMRNGDREYFFAALDRHFPGMKARYLKRYGNAYECPSDRSPQLLTLFHQRCEQLGMMHDTEQIFQWMNAFPDHDDAACQLSMFDDMG